MSFGKLTLYLLQLKYSKIIKLINQALNVTSKVFSENFNLIMIFLMLYLPEGEAIITFVLYFAVKKKKLLPPNAFFKLVPDILFIRIFNYNHNYIYKDCNYKFRLLGRVIWVLSLCKCHYILLFLFIMSCWK